MDNHKQLERCIELIESGLEKARRFYRYSVIHMNLQQAGESCFSLVERVSYSIVVSVTFIVIKDRFEGFVTQIDLFKIL